MAFYIYSSQIPSTAPLHRFFSSRVNHFFYTADEAERVNVINTLANWWTYQRVEGYVPTTAEGASRGETLEKTMKVDSGCASNDSLPHEKVPPDKTFVENDNEIVESGTLGDENLYGIVFPLAVSGGKVAASVFDVDSEEEAEAFVETDALVAVSGVETGRRYRLEVSVEDSDGVAQVVHASAFERRDDAPDGLGDSARARADAGTGVGNPSERIVAPEADGPITLRLWSAARGVVETREGVVGGETVEFAIPDWNCWHWIGGWRESDDALVLSLWLRHELEAE